MTFVSQLDKPWKPELLPIKLVYLILVELSLSIGWVVCYSF